MHTTNTPHRSGAQDPIDFFDEMRRANRSPTLDLLLKCSPRRPLFNKDDVEYMRSGPITPVKQAACRREAQRKRRKFRGFIAGHFQREHLKYGPMPADNAPLAAWVTIVLNHASSKWSGEISSGRIQHQFRDWLPTYFDDNRYFWGGAPTRWLEAAELVRMACGLPRFRATRKVQR